MWRVLISAALIAALGWVCLAAFVYFFQAGMVFFPTKGLVAGPGDVGLEHEEVVFSDSRGLKLHGWFVPAARARAAVLFCHGNAGNMSNRLETLALLNRLGLSVFIFDYAGYGRSQGRPSEPGTYADARAAWDWLTKVKGAAPSEVVIMGRSLGAAVAADLAARVRPAGLILESAFTSAADLGAEIYPFLPVRMLCRFKYDTLARLRDIDCPVLIAHSPEDEVAPFEHGRRLFEAYGGKKTFLRLSGGHNAGLIESGEDYARGLDGFFAGLGR
ncbi:MAG: alpha/beta hydrolase [Desulfovibrionaceae bacterium]|nr:alpha/beta hydrolase [Desulfovibrionaceae bacterium]